MTLLLIGCDQSVPFTIDNPTSEPIELQLDGEHVQLAQHSSSDVKLTPGRHLLQSEHLGKISFIVYVDRPGALINPTLSDYVLLKVNNAKARTRTIVLDDELFSGQIRKLNALFIDKQWQYGVNQALPAADDKTAAAKLFRAQDYMHYAQAQAKPVSASDSAINVTERLQQNQAQELEQFEHPTLQKLTYPMRFCYQQYIWETDAEEQQKLQKCSFDEIRRFTKIVTDFGADITPVTEARLRHFRQQFSRVFSTSVLIIAHEAA